MAVVVSGRDGTEGLQETPPVLAVVVLAACMPRGGSITVNDGDDLACSGQVAPALQLEGRLDDDPGAERVRLTYAVIVDGREGDFPGLAPTAIPVSDSASLTVDYRDDRTREALCQDVAFDTYTQDGERTFLVRTLRERDQNVLAEGRFSIMMTP